MSTQSAVERATSVLGKTSEGYQWANCFDFENYAQAALGWSHSSFRNEAGVGHRAKLYMEPAYRTFSISSEAANLAWYALYAKHQHEKSAAKLLTQKGFETLAPVYSVKHRWRDRTKQIFLPVFPCYLFVRASLDRKLDILRTSGIFSMVSRAGQPCVVSEEDMQLVRQVSSNPDRMEPHAYLRTGEFVRVRVGPFAGLIGVLTRIKNLFRVVLTVELLQKSVALELDASILDPCDSPHELRIREMTESRRIA